MSRAHYPALALAAACLATALVYWGALAGPFLLDDYDAIFPLAAHHATGADWLEILRNAPAHIRARWVSNFTFLASQAMGGSPLPQAFAYKLGNLVVHLACGLATWLLARRVLAVAGESDVRSRWLAVLAAALFLLHPLLVSTVLYPVQRMAQLSTLFLLLAVHEYVRWRVDLPRLSAPANVLRIVLCAGLAALAFLSKENGALAPLLFGVVELSLFRVPGKNAPERPRYDIGAGLLILAPLMLGVVAFALRWPRTVAGYARRDFTMYERLLTQVHALGDYLCQILWPRISGMGLYRDDFPVQNTLDLATLGMVLLYAALIGLAIAMRRRAPVVALGVLWFFAAHALESSFIALELVFEHRNYIALIGPALAVAWGIGRLTPRMSTAVALAMLIGLGAQTARRAHDWRGYESWILAEVSHHPGSLRAGTDLFVHLAARGKVRDAIAERARLADQFPGHAQPEMLKLAFACRASAAPVGVDPIDPAVLSSGRIGKDALHVYGALRDRQAASCKTPDWPSFASTAEALAANPAHRQAASLRAAWWRLAAGARLRAAEWPKVRTALEHALDARDDDPRDWLLLAEAAARTGDLRAYALARQRFLALVRGQPGDLRSALAEVDRLARDARQ